MAKKALGKGLGAIIKETPVLAKEEKRREAPGNVSRETSIRISLIEPNRKQPREQFREESLGELADSIKKYGVLQPLLVKKKGMMYEIIAGERRWRAAKLAGLKEVPVIVKEFDPKEAAEIAIIENIQREDLGPVEEARAYQSLMEEFGLTQEEVAERVSKNRSTITNSLRLLQLSEKVLSLLSEGSLSAGHARCLIPLEQQKQEQVAEEILAGHLSVRETEKLVKELQEGRKKNRSVKKERTEDIYLAELARLLESSLHTKVQIRQGSKGRGRIEIEYYSNEDLEKLMDRLRQ